MPWKDVRPMDEKILFIADHLRETDCFSRLCERYGISRKTGYKWVARYRETGADGLQEQSRRPRHATGETPYAIQQAILELRHDRQGPPGPKKIQALLTSRFDAELVPSKTTIYNILRRAGQIEPQRRVRRVKGVQHILKSAAQPNENGRWCYPLTVMDHASRYLLVCHGLPGTRFSETQAIFEQAFRHYGLPERLRTDNGVPFARLGVGGLSQLSVWWIRLGILPERITPGRPQQNGRHERMHRTLGFNRWMQQIQLEGFRTHYNDERPHEGLAQQCPSTCYTPSLRSYPTHLPDLEYPGYFERQRVSQNGLIYWRALRVYIGYLLAGEWVGMEPMADGLWDVYFGPVRIGGFDERETKGQRNDYLTLKM